MSEWQPIETAPKDGKSYILVWGPSYAVAQVSFYYNGRWIDACDPTIPRKQRALNLTLTHWMQLPEPPHPIEGAQ